MKKLVVSSMVVAGLACCSVANAGITSASWGSTGNAIQLTGLYPFTNDRLGMTGIQYASGGLMSGTITTDTIADPTLTLGSSVNNDTGHAWVGYQVNVYMSVPFSFVGPGPSVSDPPMNDWMLSGASTPAWNGSAYEGSLQFSAGTPVGVGGELDFLYSISFGSSMNYSFSQEMIPVTVPVPEPCSLALLGLGGCALFLRRRSAKV